jgi:hypothetical protein
MQISLAVFVIILCVVFWNHALGLSTMLAIFATTMAAPDNKQRRRAIRKIERVLGRGKILWSWFLVYLHTACRQPSLVAGCYYTDVRGEARIAISIKSDAGAPGKQSPPPLLYVCAH